MVTIKELEKQSKKGCWSKFNYAWHYLGLYTAKPLLKTGITPNQITIFWILLEIFGAILLLGSYWYRVASIIIFNFVVTLLDFTDGNVARIKKITSSRGIYLEHIGLFVGTPLMLLFLGLGIYIRNGSINALFFGIIGCIALLYDKLFSINPSWFDKKNILKIQKVYYSSGLRKKNIVSHLSNLFRRGQPFNILLIGIILNYLEITLIIYTVASVLFMLYKLITQYRAAGKLDDKSL
ncbi:MAG: CDP-alcohol phosphatidyltransferase family protein [Nanoarchaeota archaeon]|nr:CDP-alcohol phosphatidyltransferase family protein [Nanoarchaeota archaeon]MBU1704937.1 CDP-alcohol phosphatidyltransferase family protein [Nanoarchaeota archaeon]